MSVDLNIETIKQDIRSFEPQENPDSSESHAIKLLAYANLIKTYDKQPRNKIARLFSMRESVWCSGTMQEAADKRIPDDLLLSKKKLLQHPHTPYAHRLLNKVSHIALAMAACSTNKTIADAEATHPKDCIHTQDDMSLENCLCSQIKLEL